MPSFGGGFSLPSFPKPTSGSGLGQFSIPSLGGLPAATSTAAAGGNLPSSVIATATSVTQATPTNPGTIGSGCTAQGSGGGIGSSENGITDKNCCTDLTVIFARGTGETGNVGTVSGPPMFKSLRTKLGAERVTVQGVDYPASAGVSLRSLDAHLTIAQMLICIRETQT
jgi:hypothetical protein